MHSIEVKRKTYLTDLNKLKLNSKVWLQIYICGLYIHIYICIYVCIYTHTRMSIDRDGYEDMIQAQIYNLEMALFSI